MDKVDVEMTFKIPATAAVLLATMKAEGFAMEYSIDVKDDELCLRGIATDFGREEDHYFPEDFK